MIRLGDLRSIHFLNQRLFSFITKATVLPFLAFIAPFAVRIIPEIISGPYPVGFDVFAYYAPNTLSWLNHGVDPWSFFAIAPLLYALLMGTTMLGAPIFWTLKLLSPALLGFLGLAVYVYTRKTLVWPERKSLLAALFATLYFIALRISFDMLRSELALIFLFFTLFLLGKEGVVRSWKCGVLLSVSLILTVLSHQLVAFLGLLIVLLTAFHLSFKKEFDNVRSLLIGVLPALLLFSLIVYANYITSPTFSVLTEFPLQSQGEFRSLFGFSSYLGMVVDTLGFLVFCYLPLLPLIAFGFKRFGWNLQMTVWVSWICAVLLWIFFSPNAFLATFPYRWILLLVYPLALIAADAFSKIKSGAKKIGIATVLVTLSVSYVVLPTNLAFPYFTLYPYYVPTSMAATTIPLTDSQDAVNTIEWAKNNMNDNSRLLVHTAFFSWASKIVDEKKLVHYGLDNPEGWAKRLQENGSASHLYLIWWAKNGWYGQPSVSPAFRQVYSSGNLAIFSYDFKPNKNDFDYVQCLYANNTAFVYD